MGNNCAGARETAEKAKEKSIAYYAVAKDKTKAGVANAKVKYAPQLAKMRYTYDQGKLRAQGFSPPNPNDNSPMGCITKFESSLPLGKISVLEFERRLKKLIDPSAGDKITERQLVEVFKDHPSFKDIEDPESLVYALMTDKVFLAKDGEGFYIPYLVLLGQLYCAGNPKLRADKFFELCQIDLDPGMSHNDKEFIDYFPKLLEISYDLMLRLYSRFKPEDLPEPVPQWTADPDELTREYAIIFEKMVDDLFGKASRLENEQFRKLMETQFNSYLQAHVLRNKVYQKLHQAQSSMMSGTVNDPPQKI